MQKTRLKELILKLSDLGEDKDELKLWSSIFQDLEPSEQTELIANLQDELTKLESLKK
jgi:hypothetical protein